MPKRNRANEQRKSGYVAPVAAVETEQARAARLFAESVRQHELADQAKRDRKAAAIDRQRRLEELTAVKKRPLRTSAGCARTGGLMRGCRRPKRVPGGARGAHRVRDRRAPALAPVAPADDRIDVPIDEPIDDSADQPSSGRRRGRGPRR